jgi:hypothetical protein
VRADSHGNRAPSLSATTPRGLDRSGEAPDAVLEYCPRRLRVGRGKHGQDVHVGVSEHVPSVDGAAQPSGPDRCFAVIRGAGEQVEDREPDGKLQLRIAVDQYVGVLPA